MKLKLVLVLLGFLQIGTGYSQDKLVDILKSELKYEYAELKKENLAPYYMNFRVIDNEVNVVAASFGSIIQNYESKKRNFVPHIRLGNNMLDNYYYSSQAPQTAPSLLPFDNNEKSIRSLIWKKVEDDFEAAKGFYNQTKTKFDIDTKQDDKAPNFVKVPITTYYEKPLTDKKYNFDKTKWESIARDYSSMFKGDDNLTVGSVQISFVNNRKYFVDTEGSSVVQNETYARIMVSATTKAADGMELPLYESYFAYSPEELPSAEVIKKDIKNMISKLDELRNAPVVNPYAGPALMAGSAAGVFFHEIFGHRIEGQRMKSSQDGQTFKDMVGQTILPKGMNVYDDPSLNEYIGSPLYGYYNYDDQGVKARRVDVVKDGVLNEFLMSRTGIDGFEFSNGHGRADIGAQPTARQGNLVIESTEHKTEKELRALLLKEIKAQGKEFGYFFKSVSAGLAFTGANQVNAFNVTPLEVYRIHADGTTPDLLVRGVDMIGTPLSMFENIKHAGGEFEIFTGDCGAESGSIPVTAIAPTILLSKVEVQRKPKSTKQLPILSRPTLSINK